MPNRILKESICTSETIEQLGWQEEAFFYRLITVCDDFGRFDGRASVIRGRCFPLRLDRVTDSDIENWLQGLQRAGLLRLYVVDGHRYLQIVTWDKHQQIRAKTSKYPAMPENAGDTVQPLAGDSNCNQTQADDSAGSHMSPYSVLENRESVLGTRGTEGCGEPNSPPPLPDATPTELAILHELKNVANYPFDYQKDLEHVRNLMTDYPELNLLAEAKKWRTYKRDKPLKPKSNARLQLRNWCEIARERLKRAQARARDGPWHIDRSEQIEPDPDQQAVIESTMTPELRRLINGA